MARTQRADDDVGRLVAGRLSRSASVDVCPDAEVIAAYIDHGLSEAERTALELHLATCSNCRTLMARLAPVGATPATAGWRLPRLDARWGSLAATLLVATVLWMAWPRSETGSRLNSQTAVSEALKEPSGAMADRAAPVASGAGASPAAPAASPPRVSPPVAASPVPAPTVAQETRAVASRPVSSSQLEEELRRRGKASEADAKLRRGLADAAKSEAVVARGEPTSVEARQSAPGPEPARPAVAASPPPPPPAQPAPAEVSARAAEAGRAVRTDKQALEERVEFSSVSPAARANAPTINGPSFAEPEGRLRWRIVQGRRIESSSDGGIKWNPTFDNGSVRLLAGSAPSVSAAWVCGAQGVVLRRVVPGGWTRVPSPTTEDLVLITATSESSARITTRAGQVYQTTDGGVTWTLR